MESSDASYRLKLAEGFLNEAKEQYEIIKSKLKL